MNTNKQNKKSFYSVIGEECQKDWKLVEHEGKLYFSNPKYKTKRFHICVIQTYDEKKRKIRKTLYPASDTEHDPYNICFNINMNGLNGNLIPNKFQDFWKTRRGKRLTKYISYRETREKTKKEYELLNPPKINKPKNL